MQVAYDWLLLMGTECNPFLSHRVFERHLDTERVPRKSLSLYSGAKRVLFECFGTIANNSIGSVTEVFNASMLVFQRFKLRLSRRFQEGLY